MLATTAAGGRATLDTPVTVVEPNETWRRHYADVFAQFASAERHRRGQSA